MAGCGPPLDAPPAAPETHALRARSLTAMLSDPADLRPEARQILQQMVRHGWDLPDPLTPRLSFAGPPKTIRVWRRSKANGSTSCQGPIDTLPLEDYVKGVLPHEWISSWHDESLRAGSIAIRTYASAWVVKGGKYTCADLCDTTYSQVYKDARLAVTNRAVDATKDTLLLKNGGIVFAEYSAENGDPTKTGVSDPVCAGKKLYGHGRGMCQWGSQRWARDQGKGHRWIAVHYYPGASLWSPPVVKPDAAPPKPDARPPKPDARTPGPDTRPPVRLDGAVPGKDAKIPSKKDRGAPKVDAGAPPPTWGASGPAVLRGGCSLGPGAKIPVWPLILLLLLVLPRIRRR